MLIAIHSNLNAITLISRFYSNYPSIDFLVEEKKIKQIDEEKRVGDEIEYNKEGLKYVDEYLDAIENLDFEYLYDFILLAVGNIIDTPYKEILFSDLDDKKLNIALPEYNGIQITPKNSNID